MKIDLLVKLLLAVAALAACLVVSGCYGSGGYGGYGGYTGLDGMSGGDFVLWANTSGQAAVWDVDSSGVLGTATAGPYSGYTPVGLSSCGTNAFILWSKNGSALITSLLDSGGTFSQSFNETLSGASGWTPASIAIDGSENIDLLWSGPGNSAAIWTVAPYSGSGKVSYTTKSYGPFAGWQAEQIAVDSNGATYILWSNSGGSQASIWTIPSGGSPSSQLYNQSAGWQAKYLAVDNALTTSGSPLSEPVILWTNKNGQVDIQTIDGADKYLTSEFLGPYTGWTAAGLTMNYDGSGLYCPGVLWNGSSGASSIWVIRPVCLSTIAYGPYAGWHAVAVASY